MEYRGRIIVHTPEPESGAALYVAEFTSALAHAGAKIALFCPANFQYIENVRKSGAEIFLMPEREITQASLPRRILRNFAFLYRSLRLHGSLIQADDIVHFQFPIHLPLAYAYYLQVKFKRAHLVLTAHDPMPHRWRFPRVLQSIERWMLQRSYRMCEQIFVHNADGMNVLSKQFQISPKRIAVVPHGMHVAAETSVLCPKQDSLRLLAFGSIRANKNLHLVIQAVLEVAKEKQFPIRLTIAGDLNTQAEESYWQSCRALIAQAPECFDCRIKHISDEEIAPLMQEHHAVVLAYADFHSESGVAVLALSHGRPLLTTQAGGLGDLIHDSEAGIVIRSIDVAGVKSGIEALDALSPLHLQEMGQKGQAYLKNSRSWGLVAQKTLQAYSTMPLN